MPRIPAGSTVLFFIVNSDVLSSLISAGVTCKVKTALIKPTPPASAQLQQEHSLVRHKRLAAHSLSLPAKLITGGAETCAKRNSTAPICLHSCVRPHCWAL